MDSFRETSAEERVSSWEGCEGAIVAFGEVLSLEDLDVAVLVVGTIDCEGIVARGERLGLEVCFACFWARGMISRSSSLE